MIIIVEDIKFVRFIGNAILPKIGLLFQCKQAKSRTWKAVKIGKIPFNILSTLIFY